MINFAIAAEVVDISTDTPNKYDHFFVDTNVWLWLAYTRIMLADKPPYESKVRKYSNYINEALNNSSALYWCGVNLIELAHLIEKTEFEIYKKIQNPNLAYKEFRHNLTEERKNVIEELEAVSIQIRKIAIPLECSTITKFSLELHKIIEKNKVDGYDALILNAINEANITNVITDDSDYASVEGIRVFTSNPTIIRLANQQGKLVPR